MKIEIPKMSRNFSLKSISRNVKTTNIVTAVMTPKITGILICIELLNPIIDVSYCGKLFAVYANYLNLQCF